MHVALDNGTEIFAQAWRRQGPGPPKGFIGQSGEAFRKGAVCGNDEQCGRRVEALLF